MYQTYRTTLKNDSFFPVKEADLVFYCLFPKLYVYESAFNKAFRVKLPQTTTHRV